MTKLLYIVYTKDNNYYQFYYNEENQEFKIVDRYNNNIDYNKNNDCITIINELHYDDIVDCYICDYFEENCKHELAQRYINNNIVDCEKFLIYGMLFSGKKECK